VSEFKTSTSSEIYIIEFPDSLDQKSAEIIKQSSKNWISNSGITSIFDFKLVKALSNKAYPALVACARDFKSNSKLIYSINLDPLILKQIKQDGLENTINPAKSIEEIKSKLNPASSLKNTLINVEFINPFILSTLETLKVQANTPIEGGKPFVKDSTHNPETAICGVISITSDQFKGNLSLIFSKNVFLKIYENMLGEKHNEITNEIQDACGELLNIIFGQAKSKINSEKGFTIQKALPTVLRGSDIRIQQTTGVPIIVIPFKISTGEFYLEIAAEPN
jgi:chemotaxis protein CheX